MDETLLGHIRRSATVDRKCGLNNTNSNYSITEERSVDSGSARMELKCSAIHPRLGSVLMHH